MTWGALNALLCAQLALVAGQVFLKHGMSGLGRRRGWNITAGIGALTVWFFLWLGLLQKLPLSFVYPFEGISPVLLVLAAWLILKEKLSWQMWVGVGLIAAGTMMVGMS